MQVEGQRSQAEGEGQGAQGASSAAVDLRPSTFPEQAREQLAGKTGRAYWRSLEELSDTPQFQAWMEDEFPNRKDLAQVDRRTILKLMGASMALAGLSGCRSVFLPQDKAVPYVKAPEEQVTGKALYYASAVTLGGYATGVLVEQHEGRPTKLEGNPDHPSSLGSLDSLSQAEIINLYDPDRTPTVLNVGEVSTWELFQAAARNELTKEVATGGAGVRILTGAVTSPTLTRTLEAFLARFPQARWHSYEPVGRGFAHEGARAAFGRPVNTVYDFSRAKVVVSLDADFLNPTAMPGSLRYAREFMNARRVQGLQGTMNRLYTFESSPTLVGAVADHRWALRGADIAALAGALSSLVLGDGRSTSIAGVSFDHLQAIASELQANRGAGIVVAGDHQPAEVHALAHAMNEALGNFGQTVFHTAPIEATASPRVGGLRALTDDLNAGRVTTLLILGGNPVYDAPADFNFGEALAKAPFKAHLSLHEDETSAACEWHLPMTHFLEEWGDARGHDGTVSLIQPLIAPLFEGRSAIEVISALNERPLSGYDLVRETWRGSGLITGDFEKGWRRAVHDGLIPNTAFKPVALTVRGAMPAPSAPASEGLEVNFRPDPTIYDGRYANNGWLQELPAPLTKLVWDNAVILSPNEAKGRNLQVDDLVELRVGTRAVRGAVHIQPGHPDGTVTVYLGHGRRRGGVVMTPTATTSEQGEGRDWGGFDAYQIRTSDAPFTAQGAELRNLNRQYGLASTQGHSPLDDSAIHDPEMIKRKIIFDLSLDEFNRTSAEFHKEDEERNREFAEKNMYPEEIFAWDGPQWGMTIDMNTCIGCNACVTACQAENNIPIVGKDQVQRHRELHWLRIDRYFSGPAENPAVTWQPLMCVHCEKAPCEPVCPVAATVHSHDGLNQMVYNRCVGTRYCSNNCPYKVRRFNFLNYSDNQRQFDVKVDNGEPPAESPNGTKQRIPLLRMLNNPDVTVRGRGVMEKCTYCVQRIKEARIESKKRGTEIKDGEIVTACQQACPTQTIVFGNINDQDSAVSKLRQDPRAYLLLQELNTRPRTSHLAKLRNPNPAISGGAA